MSPVNLLETSSLFQANPKALLRLVLVPGNLEIVGLLHYLGLPVNEADAYGQVPIQLQCIPLEFVPPLHDTIMSLCLGPPLLCPGCCVAMRISIVISIVTIVPTTTSLPSCKWLPAYAHLDAVCADAAPPGGAARKLLRRGVLCPGLPTSSDVSPAIAPLGGCRPLLCPLAPSLQPCNDLNASPAAIVACTGSGLSMARLRMVFKPCPRSCTAARTQDGKGKTPLELAKNKRHNMVRQGEGGLLGFDTPGSLVHTRAHVFPATSLPTPSPSATPRAMPAGSPQLLELVLLFLDPSNRRRKSRPVHVLSCCVRRLLEGGSASCAAAD